MTDQQTPEVVRARVMELEQMSTKQIMALPPINMQSDEGEIVARASVMLARVRQMSQQPGGGEALANAFEQVRADMTNKGASTIARLAFSLVGKFFSGAR